MFAEITEDKPLSQSAALLRKHDAIGSALVFRMN